MLRHQINDEVHLELLETRHAEELYRLTDRNRDRLREWLPWLNGTRGMEDSEAFIRTSLQHFANANGGNFGVFYRGQMAGCIGLHNIDWGNRKTSIGYWLGADFQRRGIMTLACGAILDYVFGELELNRAEIRAAEFNARSRAIPERLGFTNEGKIRQAEWLYDHYVDHVVYGMLRDEWLQRRKEGQH
ncbi:alanine acetyltransferase [Gordoniibacillus kamchatkensis]|uniref:Alanine acetyltransferase n=1 Tax=Gordoniibacillus kamchatkensis TaxID=1590651 RepID=A0ABR5ACW1_9BACL|nr:GNAT family protein [Paenibacillus sp. VKM B-2647]KIL38795.1 alanine acetyltransferase [Paenibacillus sp. VKM B-2647]